MSDILNTYNQIFKTNLILHADMVSIYYYNPVCGYDIGAFFNVLILKGKRLSYFNNESFQRPWVREFL